MMHAWRLIERSRGRCLVPALALAAVALAGPPDETPPAAKSPEPPSCTPGTGAGVIVTVEKLYQEQRFESAMSVVRLGLGSCGIGPLDLARLHLLDGILKFEEFKEKAARDAFAAALALDIDLIPPSYMSPRARQLFDAVKAATPRPERPDKELTVVEVRDGRAVFPAGTEEGFRQGSKVRVTPRQKAGRPTAVLRVAQADMHRAAADLGRGDQVQPGDLVEATDEPPSERLLFPRRAAFTSRIGFYNSPTLTSSTDVSIIGDVYYAWYHPGAPVALQIRLGRAGLSSQQSSGGMGVTGAWATDLFEIGLGAGFAAGNGYSRATCNQILRLGSLDGLNVIWESSLFLVAPAGAFRVELNVPLLSRLNLFSVGGGGNNGLSFVEGGIRAYLSGAGGRGTVILSASGGFTWLVDTGLVEAGPSVGFGVEWRL